FLPRRRQVRAGALVLGLERAAVVGRAGLLLETFDLALEPYDVRMFRGIAGNRRQIFPLQLAQPSAGAVAGVRIDQCELRLQLDLALLQRVNLPLGFLELP